MKEVMQRSEEIEKQIESYRNSIENEIQAMIDGDTSRKAPASASQSDKVPAKRESEPTIVKR